MTSAQVVQLHLVSANKAGIYADQERFGQGLLDLDAVTRPIGNLMVEAASDALSPLSAMAVRESSPLGNAIASRWPMLTWCSRMNLIRRSKSRAMLNDERVGEFSRIDSQDYLLRINEQISMRNLQFASVLNVSYQAGLAGSELGVLGKVQAMQNLGKDVVLSTGLNTDPLWSKGLLRAKPALRDASMTPCIW